MQISYLPEPHTHFVGSIAVSKCRGTQLMSQIGFRVSRVGLKSIQSKCLSGKNKIKKKLPKCNALHYAVWVTRDYRFLFCFVFFFFKITTYVFFQCMCNSSCSGNASYVLILPLICVKTRLDFWHCSESRWNYSMEIISKGINRLEKTGI